MPSHPTQQLPQAFCAYPSTPASCGDAIRAAADKLNDKSVVLCTTWEDLAVGGRVLISAICDAIDDSQLVIADITGLNPNVLFELGYAIAKEKRIWLLMDTSYSRDQGDFKSFRLLTTTGYVSYSNSEHIVAALFKDSPHLDLENTLSRDLFQERLSMARVFPLFYMRTRTTNEAGIRIDSAISRLGGARVDDPDESSNRSLAEYAQIVWGAQAILAHLANPTRNHSLLDNARQSLVAGMAHGWQRPLLILAEGDFMSPADYRDLAKHYKSASHAETLTNDWLVELEDSKALRTTPSLQHQEFSGDIRTLDLGDYVAENEEINLVELYYLETQAYRNALKGQSTIFVGQKGTGKTANLLKLRSTLSADKRNLVVTIKPLSYELNGLVQLLKGLNERESRGHVLENLWTYLVYTEIARALAEQISARNSATHSEPEQLLLQTYQAGQLDLQESFTIRLERAVDRLLDVSGKLSATGKEKRAGAVSEALHLTLLKDLKELFFAAIDRKTSVFVLIDNLDKAWDQTADIDKLVPVMLSLFAIVNNIHRDFLQGPKGPSAAGFSMCLFIRADIFARVLEQAREPDKIPYRTIRWTDCETLLRVAEERFEALSGEDDPREFWSRYFCKSVNNCDTRDFVCGSIRPRPRDLLYLLNKSTELAVNRRHTGVLEEDMLDALFEYSKFAFESLLVENGISISTLEEILFELVGSPAVMSESVIEAAIKSAGVPQDRIAYVVDHLIQAGFWGLEINDGKFWFADDLTDLKRNIAVSRKHAGMQPRQMSVHPAYRPYLELTPKHA